MYNNNLPRNHLCQKEEGQSLVEYSLILALVAIISILVLTTVGQTVTDTYQCMVGALQVAQYGHGSGMTLIDAGSDIEVRDVACGSTISKSEVGVNSFSLHANFENAGSVVFEATGAVEYNQTENMYPFALFGGSTTNYNGQSFVTGRYRVTATAYSGSGGSGEVVGKVTIIFTVVD